jgi:hypothetical protein
MQFDREFISKLGTKSLSHDPALTKERVNTAWNLASKEKQNEVLFLADVKYAIAYRVRSMGTTTTKMTIAYSQALNLDPYYLIGAADVNNGYTYDSAKRLLIENKCGKLVKAFELAYKPPKKDPPPSPEPGNEQPSPEPVKELSPQAAIQKLSDGDLMAMLLGLLARARAGKPQAIIDLTKITEILLG